MSLKKVYLIEDYIIPSLMSNRFGKFLEWEDERNGIFRVFWCHKSGRAWDENDFIVFTTWDALNGRTEQGDDYYTISKGRFRSALNRLKSEVTLLGTADQKKYRRYQLKKYNVNNKNTTLKLKRRKQNRFSHNKSDSTLNMEIINKQVDYNSLFSEAVNQLLSDKQSQLSPSGSSDSSSIFNSENNSDSEYQENGFDSNHNNEELNLFDSDSFGADSKNDLYQLHGDTILSEEEITENKRNELKELQVNNENTALKLKKIKQNCFSVNNITSKQEFLNLLNSPITIKQDDYNSSSFSEAKNDLQYLQRDEESQLSSTGSSDLSSIFNTENDNDNEYQQKDLNSGIENINEYQQEAFDSGNIEEIWNLSDSSSHGVDCNNNYSDKHLIQLHGYIPNSEESKIENKENDLMELEAMDIEELSTIDISDWHEFIYGTDQHLPILEMHNLENISP